MSSLSRHFSEFISSSGCYDRRPIVFIDSRIAQCDHLVQQAAPNVRVFVFGSSTNGVAEITQALRSSHCQEAHLICTGIPGCLHLGGSELSKNTLIQHEAKLQRWFSHLDLTCSPQLYLHGNNVAMGDIGAEFIARLNWLTGAAISASPRIYNSKVFN